MPEINLSPFYFNISSFNFAKIIFSFLILFSLIGYIPGFPYWLYNISTFVSIPIFLVILLIRQKQIFTFNELIFIFLFFVSIFLSYFFSDFGFTLAGFLRTIVPIIIYYIVRILNIHKGKFYFNCIYNLLVLSFLFVLYQFFFQPNYVLDITGSWEIIDDDGFKFMRRPSSFLGNANVFGVFNIYCFIILFIENNNFINYRKKLIITIIVLINIILFSKSRTSILGFFIIIMFYNFKFKNFKILFFLFVSFILIFIYVLLHYEQFIMLDQLFRLSSLTNDENNSYTIRKNIAEYAYNLISQRPFFGVGPANEGALMNSINAPHKGMESASLHLLIERGFVGYFFYLYVVIIKLLFSINFSNFLIGVVIISVDFTETVCVFPQLTSFLAIYFAVSKNHFISIKVK